MGTDVTGHSRIQVRKLEGFKKSLLSRLAEEAGTVLPASASPDPLPDSEQLVQDILAQSKSESLPARPSLVQIESRALPARCGHPAQFRLRD